VRSECSTVWSHLVSFFWNFDFLSCREMLVCSYTISRRWITQPKENRETYIIEFIWNCFFCAIVKYLSFLLLPVAAVVFHLGKMWKISAGKYMYFSLWKRKSDSVLWIILVIYCSCKKIEKWYQNDEAPSHIFDIIDTFNGDQCVQFGREQLYPAWRTTRFDVRI
jgi:hypothetical protein